jgi:PAS domain S-box-containing protein
LEKLVVERTDELNTLSVNLEQRVADRTRALEISAEVSRSLASILDPAQLASTVVNQVRDAFNYYYAQIYLFDATGENLVLTAGTGEAGAVMLKRRHSLPKGRGLVRRAAETKESILVSDTSQDPNWLPNDLLPDTKAEAAIPIAIGDQVLGVLDVQDNLTNDINPADITLLESLANQVAISLQNASSYARAEEALQEAQSLVENAPEAILIVDVETGLFSNPNENALKLFGLSREELSKTGPVQTSPLTQPDGRNSAEKASELINETIKGTTSIFEWTLLNKQGQEILCEVRLVRLPGKTARVRASITDISGRKRVEEQIRRRAQQQESLNLITQRIQSATTIESALQITARELGRALGQKPTLVTLAPGNLNGEREIGS